MEHELHLPDWEIAELLDEWEEWDDEDIRLLSADEYEEDIDE